MYRRHDSGCRPIATAATSLDSERWSQDSPNTSGDKALPPPAATIAAVELQARETPGNGAIHSHSTAFEATAISFHINLIQYRLNLLIELSRTGLLALTASKSRVRLSRHHNQ